MGSTDRIPAEVDTETPSAARLYDYHLGGGYHFEAYRKLAQRIHDVLPETPHTARMNRAFLRRAAEFCARLVPPGLVFVPRWRPNSPEDAEYAERSSFCGAVGLRH